MSSGLVEPPEGEQLCIFLLRDEVGEAGERRREVGCQWEGPEEEKREVGCQSDSAERRDAAVQVDLLTQQLSWRHTGSSEMLLQCFAVRPDGPDGGALLQHCTTNRPRTRPRPIKPTQSNSRSQRRTPSRRSNTVKQRLSQRRHLHHEIPAANNPQEEEDAVPDVVEDDVMEDDVMEDDVVEDDVMEDDVMEDDVVEEDVVEDDVVEDDDVVEEDAGDPTWTPPEGAVNSHPSALEEAQLDSGSQHAPLLAVKLEPDSTMCDVCGKVMKNKSSLARHSFIHTGKKPFACHLCELQFNRRDNLQHHLSRLHPGGVARRQKLRQVQAWLCAVCGKTFSCRSRLKTHEVIHSGVKPHHCNLCPKAYMRTNDLEHHKKMAHVDGAMEPHQPSSLLCDLCGKEFKCRSQLAVHFQTHTGERPHLCDVCGRKFGRQYQLKRHKILVHANHANSEGNPPPDTLFSCGVCGKRLKSEVLLAAHSRIHSGDKPHRCGICLRGFQRATCLKQHHVRIHLRVKVAAHAGNHRKSTAAAKVFPCPICSKVFKFKSLLASHSLIHSENRPYNCDFCSRSFRRLSHLKRHREVVHANGARLPQTFVCHICGKDKKCRSQLARHIIIHTGERPFACDLCTARFNRRGNLQQHRKRMHGVGKAVAEEAPPILFDDDMMPALTYKQEEMVFAVDAAAEGCEVAMSDEMDAVQQLATS